MSEPDRMCAECGAVRADSLLGETCPECLAYSRGLSAGAAQERERVMAEIREGLYVFGGHKEGTDAIEYVREVILARERKDTPPPAAPSTCDHCNGQGKVYPGKYTLTCRRCEGTGEQPAAPTVKRADESSEFWQTAKANAAEVATWPKWKKLAAPTEAGAETARCNATCGAYACQLEAGHPSFHSANGPNQQCMPFWTDATYKAKPHQPEQPAPAPAEWPRERMPATYMRGDGTDGCAKCGCSLHLCKCGTFTPADESPDYVPPQLADFAARGYERKNRKAAPADQGISDETIAAWVADAQEHIDYNIAWLAAEVRRLRVDNAAIVREIRRLRKAGAR
jgi:hypothetical protein